MATSFLLRGNTRILFVDYRQCKNDDEMIAVLNEESDLLQKSGGEMLVLADFTDVLVGGRYMDAVKRAGVDVRIHKTRKTALLGVVGVKRILLSGYLRFTGDKTTKPFDTPEQAFAWLMAP